MALSVINFRMHHGNAMEQITFSGNGLKLLDLKKEILDKKEISRSLDFDLKIVDENGKVYAEDDEVVPKNASIVVRRVPSKNSLVSRLNNRGMAYGHSAAIAAPKAEIVMPMKMEVEEEAPAPQAPAVCAASTIATPLTVASATPPPSESPVLSAALAPANTTIRTTTSVDGAGIAEAQKDEEEGDVLALLEEEETTLKRTIPINSSWSSNGIAPTMSGVPADSRYGGRGGRGAGAYGKPPPTSGGYICNRCQKTGHIAKFCPTIGDSTYDPEIRLMNVPRTGRKRVTTLEGIDTSMSTVIQHSDGSYEVFESSASGLEKLTKEGGSGALSNIDMEKVPSHLKCALSNTLLNEAVTLPCCQRSVNDSVIRPRLVSSGLTCPLCNTPNISPDSLVIRKDLREQVDLYVASLRKVEDSPAQQIPSGPAFPAGFSPPPPAGPPPPQSLIGISGIAAAGTVPNGSAGMPGMMGHMGMMVPGMGMGGGMGMYPGMAMALPPGFDEVPPLEALPVPLSREQFLYEQRLQIMILKEMNGGVLPRSNPTSNPAGMGMGYYAAQGPGRGRGFHRGGDFGGRGFRGGGGGGRGYDRDNRAPADHYHHHQPQTHGYAPKDRDYGRTQQDADHRYSYNRDNREASANRGRDSRDRDARRSSRSRERDSGASVPTQSKDSRRSADRPRERVDKRERSMDKIREDSRERSGRDKIRDEASSRGEHDNERDQNSKRRRHENGSSYTDHHSSRSNRDRTRDEAPREKDRDRTRDREKEKERGRDREKERSSRSEHEKEKSSRRSRSPKERRDESSMKPSAGREDKRGDWKKERVDHHEKDKSNKVSRDKRRSNSRDRKNSAQAPSEHDGDRTGRHGSGKERSGKGSKGHRGNGEGQRIVTL